MATGYTSPIYEGKPTTFREFALRCSRALMYHVLSRDEPIDAPPPERYEVSDYHAKALAKAKSKLKELRGTSKKAAEALAAAEYRQAAKYRAEEAARAAACAARYEAMIREVEAWKPPTKDHAPLRDFMLQQLREGLRYDGRVFSPEPLRDSGAEWLAEAIARAERDVKYHAEEHAAELARTKERNEWIAALLRSLPK